MLKDFRNLLVWLIGLAVIVYFAAIPLYRVEGEEVNWWPVWWLWIVAAVAGVAVLALLLVSIRLHTDEAVRSALESDRQSRESAARSAESSRTRLDSAMDKGVKALKDSSPNRSEGNARVVVPGQYTYGAMVAQLQTDGSYIVKWVTNRAVVGRLRPGVKGGFDVFTNDHGHHGWAKNVKEGVELIEEVEDISS